MDVNAADISVKVGAHYPGRSADLPCATGIERCRDGSAEVSRGHSRSIDRTEGPNVKYVAGALNFDEAGDADNRAGMPGYSSGVRGRNPQGPVAGAPNFTARRENSRTDEVQLRVGWSNDTELDS